LSVFKNTRKPQTTGWLHVGCSSLQVVAQCAGEDLITGNMLYQQQEH